MRLIRANRAGLPTRFDDYHRSRPVGVAQVDRQGLARELVSGQLLEAGREVVVWLVVHFDSVRVIGQQHLPGLPDTHGDIDGDTHVTPGRVWRDTRQS